MASEDASTTFSLSIPREADIQTYWLLFNNMNSVGLKETAQGSPMCPDIDSSMCEWEGKSFFQSVDVKCKWLKEYGSVKTLKLSVPLETFRDLTRRLSLYQQLQWLH